MIELVKKKGMGRGKLGVYFFLPFLHFSLPSISFVSLYFSTSLISDIVFPLFIALFEFGVNSGVIHRIGIIIGWDFGHWQSGTHVKLAPGGDCTDLKHGV